MTPAEAREKVIKLLRLGRSSNAHEAELAIHRAMELAQRFSFSIEELNLDKDLEAFVEKDFHVGARISFEQKLAADVVLNFFNCGVVLGRPYIHFAGTASAVEIGEYVFVFLVRVARRQKGRFKKANPRARFSTVGNYLRGFFLGIMCKLDNGRAKMLETTPGFELALRHASDRITDYCKRRWQLQKRDDPKLRKNPDALGLGYRHGQNVNISKPIHGPELVLQLEAAP